jgi:hypothetical protein
VQGYDFDSGEYSTLEMDQFGRLKIVKNIIFMFFYPKKYRLSAKSRNSEKIENQNKPIYYII